MNCSISLAVHTDPGHDPSSKLRFFGRRIEAGRFILGAAKMADHLEDHVKLLMIKETNP